MSSSSVAFFPPQWVEAKIADKKEIRIASWNLCDFSIGGVTCKKREHHGTVINPIPQPQTAIRVYSNMTNIMNGTNYALPGTYYDLIFVQELKAVKNNPNLTGLIILGSAAYMGSLGYNIASTPYIPSNGGNREGYGVFYKNPAVVNNMEWTGTQGVNPHINQGYTDLNTQTMVRPPMKANFTIGAGDYNIIVYNNHIAPIPSKNVNDQTRKEIQILQDKINYDSVSYLTEANMIVLGDLNAGGNYLDGGLENNNEFSPMLRLPSSMLPSGATMTDVVLSFIFKPSNST